MTFANPESGVVQKLPTGTSPYTLTMLDKFLNAHDTGGWTPFGLILSQLSAENLCTAGEATTRLTIRP